MTFTAAHIDPPVEDPVGNILKWVLLVVAIATFGLLAWATVETYRTAQPQPDCFVTADGAVLIAKDGIRNDGAIAQLTNLSKLGPMTLLYAAHYTEHNHAIALSTYLSDHLKDGHDHHTA